VVASATFTDPSPLEGKGFTVFIRNGTGTVGGTGYSVAGTQIRRIFHSGSWANYTGGGGGGGGYLVSGSAPVDTSVSWADSGNTYAGMYPIRRYIDGAWEPVNPNMDFYDPIGDIISRGRPLLVGVAGQSNTATAFNRPYLGSKDAAYLSSSTTSINTVTATVGTSITVTIGTGLSWKVGDNVNLTSSSTPAEFIIGRVTAYNSGSGSFTFTVIFAPPPVSSYTDWVVTRQFTGDIEKDNRITLWNADANAWVVPDYTAQPSGGTTNNWSWNLCPHGANNIQTFSKEFIKATGRAVRIVQWREGGTPIAYWEQGATSGGFPGWVALNTEMISSGITGLDLFLFVQGEGGLSTVTYVSQYASYHESLYKGIMNNVRKSTWGKPETVFIMPSIATGMEVYPVSEQSDPVEYAIRSLNDGTNLYNAWAQGSNEKDIRVPTAGEGLFITSTTSVNPATLTAGSPFTITVQTGLAAFPDPVWIVSRSDNAFRVRCTQNSYTSGTGALSLTPTSGYIFGSGAKTDWDVLPQDFFHLNVNDNVANGKAIYQAYANLGFTKKQRTAQRANPGSSAIFSVLTEHTPSDLTQDIYITRSLNSGTARSDEYGTGGSTRTNKVFAKATGANSEIDIIHAASTATRVTDADESFRETHYGLKLTKPIFHRYVAGVTAFQARIQPTTRPGSYGWDYIGSTTGFSDATHRFYHGNNLAFEMYEGGSYGHENVFQKSLVAQDNTTEKTRRATENRVGLFSSSMTAGSTLTSTVYQNNPITSIPPYTVIHVDVTVVGLVNNATQTFTAKGSATFHVETYGTVVLDYSGPVEISNTGIIASLTFSVVSGQISATLTRGATVGDFRVSSVTNTTLKTY
jgi:hypothetical protein